MWTRRFEIEHTAPVQVAGVHFKPWGLSHFIDLPSTELRDQWLPIDAVWKQSLGQLRDRIARVTSTGEVLRILESELRSRLVEAPTRGLQLVDHTARLLEASWEQRRSEH